MKCFIESLTGESIGQVKERCKNADSRFQGRATLGWTDFFAAALGGGLTVKALDIFYQELRQRLATNNSAKQFVDEHLDPLLKAADELVGKLRSLAERDFAPLQNANLNRDVIEDHEFGGVIFLFGRFWAQVELIRRRGMSIAMAKDPRGAQLQKFFDCLDSRRVRLFDRILQRAIGESFLQDGEVISYVTFVDLFGTRSEMRQWTAPIAKILSRTVHTAERQKVLQYGIVIHALVDTLDPIHAVTRERPSMPNKLTHRSWVDLNYRVFGVYLTFVGRTRKYLGPPKRVARKKG